MTEMEERTKSMLKIVEEDGDSFAKKAEMYFKKRPELIAIVEETYKAYRALAERYDHISGELHKANHTIATAFPDQIHFDPQDEEDDNLPESITSIDPSKLRKPSSDIPQIPLMNKAKENLPGLKKSRLVRSNSQGSKEKAEEEIGRLQKGILVLQTKKEFIKCSYEEEVAKYWDIEKKISEMQEEVFLLQEGYNANVVIEDDEARALMAATALKSCEDTLNNLQEQQKRSIEEARTESERIKIAKEKLASCNGEGGQSEKTMDTSEDNRERPFTAIINEEISGQMKDKLKAEPLCVNVEENVETSLDTSVEELAEKINELVAKVISLEVTTSSQIAEMKSMRMESDGLHKTLQSFEEEKKTLIEESNSLRERLKRAEEMMKMHNTEDCQQDEKRLVDRSSAKACPAVGDISEEPMFSKPKKQVNISGSSKESETPVESIETVTDYDKGEVREKEILGVEQCGLDGKSMMDNNLAGNSHVLDDIPEKMMSSKNQSQSTSVVPSHQLTALHKIETPKDSGKTESIVILDKTNNLVTEKSQSLKEPDSCLNDHKIFGHPEAGSPLKNDSVPVVLKKDGIMLSQTDDAIHPSKKDGTQLGGQEVPLDWLQSLANGSEGKEKLILEQYTSILRSYKEAKKMLSEAETKNQKYCDETKEQMKKLESANVTKDEEIRSLRRALRSLQSKINENADTHLRQVEESSIPQRQDSSSSFEAAYDTFLADNDTEQDSDGHNTTSVIEGQFRRDIDTLFEENLEFWLRFSTSFQNIQKFQTAFEDLQAETAKLKKNKSEEGSSHHSSSGKKLNAESQHIDKKVRELKTELQVWLEQHRLLQAELQTRFSALGGMQEVISGALELSLQGDGLQFAPYQAAKFQGELLNIQMENNKVADELQAGLDHVSGLQAELEKTISRLHGKSELSESTRSNNQQYEHLNTKGRGVPLRSFLFTGKPKKKQSIFSCVHPTLQKHANELAIRRQNKLT